MVTLVVPAWMTDANVKVTGAVPVAPSIGATLTLLPACVLLVSTDSVAVAVAPDAAMPIVVVPVDTPTARPCASICATAGWLLVHTTDRPVLTPATLTGMDD